MLYVAKSCCEGIEALPLQCLDETNQSGCKVCVSKGTNTDVRRFLTVLMFAEHVLHSRFECASVLEADPHPALLIEWATPDMPECQAAFTTLAVLT